MHMVDVDGMVVVFIVVCGYGYQTRITNCSTQTTTYQYQVCNTQSCSCE